MSTEMHSRMFKDEQYSGNLLKNLNKDRHLEKPKFCDLTIFAENKKFPAHKCVLGLMSDCYDNLFCDKNLQKYAGDAHIDGVRKEIMSMILDYLYTGTICISSHNVDDIKEAAAIFGINGIIEYCDTFSTTEEDANTEKSRTDGSSRCPAGFRIHKPIENMSFDGVKTFTEELSLTDRYDKVIGWIKHDITKRGRYAIEMLEWLNMSELLHHFLLQKKTNQKTNDNTNKVEPDATDLQNSLHLDSHKQKELETKFQMMIKFFEDETIQGYYKSLTRNPGFLALKKKEVWKYDITNQTLLALPNLKFDHYQGSMVQIGDEIMVISGWRTAAVETLCLTDDLPFWKKISDVGSSMKLAGCAACKHLVFCVGGTPYKNSGVRYDNIHKRWTEMHVLQHDRSDGPALVCVKGPDKKPNLLYAVGGDDSNSKTSERFDSHEGKRTSLPDMKEHRSKVAAVALHGEIYAIGGLDEHNKNLASVEKYNPHHSHWTHVPGLNVARHCHGACVVDDKIYVAGGGSNILEMFDLNGNTWRKLEKTFEELKEVECLIPV